MALLRCTSAFGHQETVALALSRAGPNLGFNRWMQHTRNCVSRRSVADETKKTDLLHGEPKGALIVDETYRDFDSRHSALTGGRPHELFTDPDWDDTLIQLYSFSKAYRLTGHRVGAIVASTARLAEVEKFLDTVAICPGQLGQIAALWGMQNLTHWVAGERDEILARKSAMVAGFSALPAWKLLGCGAYFAYVQHPFHMSSDQLCKRLVTDASLLMLPGTMFRPQDDLAGAGELRIAFANVDAAGIGEMFSRLAAFRP